MRMAKQVTPPNGWKYLQGDCWILGWSFDNLVGIVKTHRINNNIPLGDVEKDIREQLMNRNPSIIIKN